MCLPNLSLPAGIAGQAGVWFEMKIRTLQKKDISAAAAICEKVLLEGGHAKTYFELSLKPTEFRRDFQHLKYFVAEESGKVIGVSGFYQWRAYPKDNGWLGYTAVNPKYQGRHVGTKLLQYIIAEAKKKKLRLMLLEMTSQEERQKKIFYEKFGFEMQGRIKDFWGSGVDQVYMSK